MIATVELQVRVTTFARAILTALRQNPRCLPPAISGIQLQRIRLKNAALRNSEPGSFRIWMDMGGYDQGAPREWINGKQVQLLVDVTLDGAQTSTINANANQLVASEFSADATVIFNVDCESSSPFGWVELVYRVHDIVPAGVPLAPPGLTPQWVKDQIAARLTMSPFKLNLGAMIPAGAGFANAGLAMSVDGSVLAARAELSAHPAMVNRWRAFHEGSVDNQLGANDWGVFVLGNQFASALGNRVWGSLHEEIDGNMLLSVGASFVPHPGRAEFILTPYLQLPVLGTEPLPISVGLSVDIASGSLVVDIDAYGIRDLVASITSTVGTILRVIMPLVGSFVAAALNDAVAGAMQTYSTKIGGTLGGSIGDLPGAAANTTVDELPGLPFRYRAILPLPAPPVAQARIQELVTSPTGFCLAGSWSLLNLAEGELDLDVSDFSWQAPRVACGAAGEAVLHDFAANPMKYVSLLSRVELGTSGTARVDLCSVAVVNPLDESAGVQVRWNVSTLPAHIDIIAPAALSLTTPLLLDIRTTIGVFRAKVQPPQPLKPSDIESLRKLIKGQLHYCDAMIRPEWFAGEGHFRLDWIVDPLVDPDRFGRVELVDLEVSGLEKDTSVMVGESRQRVSGVAVAGRDGVARLQFSWEPGTAAPLAFLRRPEQGEGMESSSRGVAVLHRTVDHQAALVFASPLRGLLAVQQSSEPRFLAVGHDQLFLVDATEAARPEVIRAWKVPGLRGAISVGKGVLAYGAAGAFLLESTDGSARPELSQREDIADAAGFADGVALLIGRRVRLVNNYGVAVGEIDTDENPRALAVSNAHLLLAGETGLTVLKLGSDRNPRIVGSLRNLPGTRFVRSGLEGELYLQRSDTRFIQLESGERGWTSVAEFATEPWVCQIARSGRTLMRLGGPFRIETLKLSERELAALPQHA